MTIDNDDRPSVPITDEDDYALLRSGDIFNKFEVSIPGDGIPIFYNSNFDHHYWNAAGECFSNRQIRYHEFDVIATFSLENLNMMLTWRTLAQS